MHRFVLTLCFALLGGAAATARADALSQALLKAAPAASAEAVRLAVDAAACAVRQGLPAAGRLAVIDYSRPSTQPRLWVFDLRRRTLLFQERVAHGRNSGENRARWFSNLPGSHASSLGLFRTLDTYVGRNGYSLRMEGLEPGVNDNALDRAIVMHGADYVSEAFIRRSGRIGRSLGCPALRQDVAHAVIDSLRGGQFVFSYFPDRRWLGGSRFLGCGGERAEVDLAP